MHYAGSFRTISRNSMQVVIVVAIAATGVAFGRWAIPAGHSSPVVTVARFDTRPSERSEAAAARKLIQMDQADDRHTGVVVAAATSGARLSVAERKLIQMDQADDRRASAAVAAATSGARLSAAERKLIQMDARDSR